MTGMAEKEGLDPARLPKHVALIMDGNGRWAKQHRFGRLQGHRRGVAAVRTAVETAKDFGIPYVTFYAFSEENWNRPALEVKGLMMLLKRYMVAERKEMMAKGVRLLAIGDLGRLPQGIQKELAETMRLTAGNRAVTMVLALSYGGRQEIVRAVRRLAQQVSAGRLQPAQIEASTLSAALDTADLPDPDLFIRTSGEMRLSNFLLWQLAYAELYVTPTLWPDFGRADFVAALRAYQGRERRFGLTSEQLQPGKKRGLLERARRLWP